VEELGDVLAEFDRDRLQAHRRCCIGFGLVVALVAIFGAIGVIGSVASGDATDPLGTALAGGGFVLVLAAIAFVPLRLARKAAQKLGMASEWWRFGM